MPATRDASFTAFCAVLKHMQSGQRQSAGDFNKLCVVTTGQYSVRQAFDGSIVLITGATGTQNCA